MSDQTADDGFEIIPAKPGTWACAGNRYWTPPAVTPVELGLPAGVYSVAVSTRIGVYLDRVKLLSDELLDLPGMGAEDILTELQQFWERKSRFDAKGFVHKRGILLHGEPGCGKTSLVHMVIRRFTEEQNGVVILTPTIGHIGAGLQLVRSREPNRPILVVMEDVDGMIAGGNESHLLSLLDGEHQVGGVVFLATTNYKDKLPGRLVARPSRFDLVTEVKPAPVEARASYIKTKAPEMSEAYVQALAEGSEGWSIAHVKELVILVEVYEKTPQEALDRMAHLVKAKVQPGQAKLRAMVMAGDDD